VSKIKTRVGGTEATFKHSVYWEYDGTNVTDASHWHETGIGVLYYYNGLATDYIDVRGDEAVSRMSGIFPECVTKHGCVDQQTIGSEVWVRGSGGWTVNQL
jgi:hypothetical protein